MKTERELHKGFDNWKTVGEAASEAMKKIIAQMQAQQAKAPSK